MKLTRDPNRFTEFMSKYKSKNEIPIVFTLQELDLFCMYIMSENEYIKMNNYFNVKKLFDVLDMMPYNGDVERTKRITFIKNGLEGILDKKILNKQMLLIHINGGAGEKELIQTHSFKELSKNEINWVNETVAVSLQYSFMYQNIDNLLEMCVKFKDENFGSKRSAVNEFSNMIDFMKDSFRRAKNTNDDDIDFSLSDGNFEDPFINAYTSETTDSNKLRTGMVGFNAMINGGFESERVYTLVGAAGSGKSMTLLNIAYQVKKYNRDYRCKDKTKKPAIVILTMENSVKETIGRLYTIVTGKKLGDTSLQKSIELFKQAGEMTISDDDPIDIIVKYKPSSSCDTSYLYSMYDNLLDKGYEMILLIQDHLKKIIPIKARNDMRLDLGENITDFKVFATEKQIPVITNTHLNRGANQVIEESKSKNSVNALSQMGKSVVGESMLIVDNSDVVMLVNKELDPSGKEWTACKLVKTRVFCDLYYFLQPNEENNPIKMAIDIDLDKPLYITDTSYMNIIYENKNLSADADDFSYGTANSEFNELKKRSQLEYITSPSKPINRLNKKKERRKKIIEGMRLPRKDSLYIDTYAVDAYNKYINYFSSPLATPKLALTFPDADEE